MGASGRLGGAADLAPKWHGTEFLGLVVGEPSLAPKCPDASQVGGQSYPVGSTPVTPVTPVQGSGLRLPDIDDWRGLSTFMAKDTEAAVENVLVQKVIRGRVSIRWH